MKNAITPPYLAPYFASKAGMDAMAVVSCLSSKKRRTCYLHPADRAPNIVARAIQVDFVTIQRESLARG